MLRQEALARLAGARLYGILDADHVHPDQWKDIAPKLIQGGVQIIQIRAKKARPEQISEWTKNILPLLKDVLVMINDHPTLVRELGVTGCHLGQEDISITDARRDTGPDAIVAKSTHSINQAVEAEEEGADFICAGPVFATYLKPDAPPRGLSFVTEICQRISIPKFFTGGVYLENVQQVLDAGGNRVAMATELLTAEDPKDCAQKVLKILNSNPKKG